MRLSGTLVAAMLVSAAAAAQHYDDGPVHVMTPWSRALPPVAKNGAAYATLANRGESSDRLVGASSPVAERVEIHTHVMEGGVMKMRPLESLELPPGEYVELAPGGLHLMLLGLKRPLKEGEEFPLTLRFENAAPVEVTVTVRPTGATGAGGHEHGESHEHHQTEHEHHGDATVQMPAAEAPTLALAVEERPAGGFSLRLTTTNFRFSREHADGEHVPGEGHAHLYVDGEKLRRVYGAHDELAPLAPGTHEVEVGLFTNDHRAYAANGRRAAERVVVRVLEPEDRTSTSGGIERIDLAIRGGGLDVERKTVRVTEGDRVMLRWSSDEEQVLHLHGYDIEAKVAPHSPVSMQFDAVLTGRFPVETHGGGHGHEPLLYFEVYPR